MRERDEIRETFREAKREGICKGCELRRECQGERYDNAALISADIKEYWRQKREAAERRAREDPIQYIGLVRGSDDKIKLSYLLSDEERKK